MATLVISDGFETGAPSATWTSVSDAGGDGSVVTTLPFEGSYCYQIVQNDATLTQFTMSTAASDTAFVAFRLWVDPTNWDSGTETRLLATAGGLVNVDMKVESEAFYVKATNVFSDSGSYVTIDSEVGWYSFQMQFHRNGESWVDVWPPTHTYAESPRIYHSEDAGAGVSQLFGISSLGDNASIYADTLNTTLRLDAIEYWDTYPGPLNLVYGTPFTAPRTFRHRSVIGPGAVGGF
jgi:hypothetical protein